MKLIAYTRVSTKEQGDNRNGLEAQVAAIKRFCELGGHELLSIREEVVSGKFDVDFRPVLKQALADAKKQGAKLIVSKLDRLARDVEIIARFMKHGCFATVEDGLEAETVLTHIKGSFAQFERERISMRTKDGLASVKARGVKLGGYQSEEHKAKALAASKAAVQADALTFARRLESDIKEWRANGKTVNEIAATLTRLAVPTARGKTTWHAKTVCNILRRIDGGSFQRLNSKD